MNASIHVAQDAEGLKQAALGLFEEAFQRRCIENAVRKADAETRLRALDEMDCRQLSPGYYDQTHYLLGLATSMELGVQYSSHDLTRDDVVGLLAIRNAKAEFDREHPFCPSCGERLDSRFASMCGSCHTSIKRGNN